MQSIALFLCCLTHCFAPSIARYISPVLYFLCGLSHYFCGAGTALHMRCFRFFILLAAKIYPDFRLLHSSHCPHSPAFRPHFADDLPRPQRCRRREPKGRNSRYPTSPPAVLAMTSVMSDVRFVVRSGCNSSMHRLSRSAASTGPAQASASAAPAATKAERHCHHNVQ